MLPAAAAAARRERAATLALMSMPGTGGGTVVERVHAVVVGVERIGIVVAANELMTVSHVQSIYMSGESNIR